MDIEWHGRGADELGVDRNSGHTLVRVDPRYFRPTEVDSQFGDESKIRDKLGWTPEISFEALVREMVDSDLALAKRDALVAKEGYNVYRHQE